jgi:hypothetical protein
MIQDQNTAGKINRATLMRLNSRKTKKEEFIKFIAGSIIKDDLMKLSIGLIQIATFISAIDGKMVKGKLIKLFMLLNMMEQ